MGKQSDVLVSTQRQRFLGTFSWSLTANRGIGSTGSDICSSIVWLDAAMGAFSADHQMFSFGGLSYDIIGPSIALLEATVTDFLQTVRVSLGLPKEIPPTDPRQNSVAIRRDEI